MEVGWGWAPKMFSEEAGRWIKERLLKWAQSPGIKGENIRMSTSVFFFLNLITLKCSLLRIVSPQFF